MTKVKFKMSKITGKKNNISHQKRVFIIKPDVKNISLNETSVSTQFLLKDFIQTTTIPGICQLAGNKGKLDKVLWIILFVIGIAMAMYQSGNLIREYIKYAVIEKSIREIEWTSEFPSATVCINNPIKWKNYSTDPGKTLHHNVKERLRNLVLTNKSVFEEYAAKQEIIFEELETLSPLERMKLGFSWNEFGIICEWGDAPCLESEMYAFNNLFYGNCITYNPGFNSSTNKYAAKSESLYITVRSDFKDIYPFLLRDKGPVLLIHPPGTAPILERRLIYNLFPGRWLRLGVSKRFLQRLKPPYVSMCVDGDFLELQKSSLYYSNETPYMYSMEACAQSCSQNAAIRYCSCIAPNIAAPPNPNFTICENRRCEALQNVDVNQLCDCKKTCLETMYEVRVDIDDRWLDQEVWKDWVRSGLNEDNSILINISEVSGFELYTASTMVETVVEEPKISWADFLGSIGGNLGLWVGISIISMVEIMELFCKVVVLQASHLFKKFK